jgi:hypothetical protein
VSGVGESWRRSEELKTEDGKQNTAGTKSTEDKKKGAPTFRSALLASVFCYTRCLLPSVFCLLLRQMALLPSRRIAMNESLARGTVEKRAGGCLVGGGCSGGARLLDGGTKRRALGAVALGCGLRLSHVLAGRRDTGHEYLFSSEVVGGRGRAPRQRSKGAHRNPVGACHGNSTPPGAKSRRSAICDALSF